MSAMCSYYVDGMNEVRLSAGVIAYEDSGGDGPVVVLLHGVAMDGTLWRHVVAGLGNGVRCIVPTLPLGGHRRPMEPDADLTVLGVARLVAEFVEALGLDDVTLVMNDWGGAQALVADGRADRIGRLVITSCEAFDNYPPGLPGRNLATLAKLPAGLELAFSLLRLKPARRLPMTWGWMSKRPVPDAVMDGWFRSLWASRRSAATCGRMCSECRAGPNFCVGLRSCAPSTARRSSSGPPRTGSCPSTTGGGSPNSSRRGGWWRSPTVTRSFRRTGRTPSSNTSPRSWRRPPP